MYDELKTEALFELEHTIAIDLLRVCEYPWQALPHIAGFIKELGERLSKDLYEYRGDGIYVAKTAKVAESAFIGPNTVICENAEIRHCAFIRGNAIVGAGTTVGNSTELKNAILFDLAQAPHFNYVGDSIYGYKSHTGAGVITSNLKSDKSNVTVMYNGERIATGLKKFGAILGDNVEVGCNSVLNPGTVVGKKSNVYPLSMVRGFVKAGSIYKTKNEIVEKSCER